MVAPGLACIVVDARRRVEDVTAAYARRKTT